MVFNPLMSDSPKPKLAAKASAAYSFLRDTNDMIIPVINETGEYNKAKANNPMWKLGVSTPKAADNKGDSTTKLKIYNITPI